MSKELPKGHPMSAHKDEVGQVMHRWKHHDPKPLHSGRGKGGKEGKVVKSQDQAIAIALSMAGKSKGKSSDHAERLVSMGYSEDVAQEVSAMLDGTYDFTTCERPNGSRYGTGGKCRKGTEVSGGGLTVEEKIQKKLAENQAKIDRANSIRKRATKGGKKQVELDAVIAEAKAEMKKLLEQRTKWREQHPPDPANPPRLLPSENAFNHSETLDFTTCERPNGSRYGTGGKCRKGTEISADEKSAIDQLSKLIPKGEKILDSSGRSHTAGGSGMSKSEKIAADVMSDPKFNSDKKRIAEMLRRGVPKDTDFITLVGNTREKLGGGSTDTVRSLVKEMPKRRAEEDVKRPSGKMIGTSPRNMAIDGLADLKKEAEDYKKKFGSRSGEEMIGKVLKMYDERIKAQEQFIKDNYGND